MAPAQARPRLAEAAHQVGPVGRQGGQILNDYQTGQRTTPWPDQASADAARKALNRAARRAGVSVGAYLADPDTGKCANCDRMRCQPSHQGQLVLHVNTFTKKESYAYMLERYGPDTSKWPYMPGGRAQPNSEGPRPVRTRQEGARSVSALPPALACPARLAAVHLPGLQRPSRAPQGDRSREPTRWSRARRRSRPEAPR
jgi:hypothetical protein